MRSGVAIAMMAALFLLVSGTETIRAAGYQRLDTQVAQQKARDRFPQTQRGLYDAIKKATFIEKGPALIDEVAFTIKDVLGQFGLGNGTDR